MGRAIAIRLGRLVSTVAISVACVVLCFQLLNPKEQAFTLHTHIGANRDRAIIDTVFHQFRADWTSTGFFQDGLVEFHAQIQEGKSYIPKRPDQSLVYTCVKGGCGGMADRQEGIVAGFLLAALTGRNFYIHYLDKCPLSDFYVPNKLDWRVPSSIHSRLLHPSTQQMIAYNEDAFQLGEILAQTNLTSIMTSDIIVFSTNQDFTRYLIHNNDWKKLRWARGMDRAKIYTSVWEHLFKLTPSLQLGLRHVVDQLYLQQDTLIKREISYIKYKVPFFDQWREQKGVSPTLLPERNGQHVRTTLVCGQFRMKRNPTQPWDNLPDDHLDVREIWDFLQKHNDSSRYRIFVATDSEDIRAQAKRIFPETLLDIPGPILHSDLAGERADLCQGVHKTLLDQLVLASCDVLVRGYKSHLGAIAAYWRGQNSALYCYNSSTVRPCSMEDRGFHWGPEYTPGDRLHWKNSVLEIQRKEKEQSFEEEEEERKRRRIMRKAVVMREAVRDERLVVMRDGRMLPT